MTFIHHEMNLAQEGFCFETTRAKDFFELVKNKDGEKNLILGVSETRSCKKAP